MQRILGPGSQRGSAPGRVLGWSAGLALLVLVLAGLYRIFVPSTSDLAEAAVREDLDDPGLRLVIAEAVEGEETPFLTAPRGPEGEPLPGPASLTVERMASLEHPVLDRADAEIFRSERLRGEEAAFYRRRAAGGEVRRIEPGPFRARGPALTVVTHPWDRVGAPLEPSVATVEGERGAVRTRLPTEGLPGGLLSMRLQVRARRPPRVLGCRVGRRTVFLHPLPFVAGETAAGETGAGTGERTFAFLSARFEAPAGAPVEVVFSTSVRVAAVELEVFGWKRSGSGPLSSR